MLCKHKVMGSSPIGSTKKYAGIVQLVEHLPYKKKVTGSSPVICTISEYKSIGRRRDLGSRGCGFESYYSDEVMNFYKKV